MTENQKNLTAGRRLVKNVVWNLIGIGTPLLVAIVAIPILVKALGTARFGVLTLVWMTVGYFNLFDLGLGRALTQLVADRLGRDQSKEIPRLIWTAMILLLGLGLLAALIVALISPWLITDVLKIPRELQSETLTAFYILAASMPFVISATGLWGIIEAHQHFFLINAVRVPLGICTFVGPLAVLLFSNSLVPIVTVLVVARLISWIISVLLCLHIEPTLRHVCGLDRTLVKQLLNFGSWMTVTNLVGPLMTYLDRFLIGTLVSMTAVAYYATPYEIVNRLGLVPGALMAVMFPAFTTSLAQDKERTVYLFNRTVTYIFLALFPMVLILTTCAHDGLNLWLGREFADNSAMVLQILVIGVFINSLAYVPFGFIQSAGRPDITAKLHLIELPFYLLTLWWLLNHYGITGAAIAWLLRVTVDTLLQFSLAYKLLPAAPTVKIRLVLMTGLALFTFILGAAIPMLLMKGLYLLLTLSLFTVAVWTTALCREEKDMIRSYLKKTALN